MGTLTSHHWEGLSTFFLYPGYPFTVGAPFILILVFLVLIKIHSWLNYCLVGHFINIIDENFQLHWCFWVLLYLDFCLQQLKLRLSILHYPWVMILELLNSLQVIILDLLSMFKLRDLDPFLVLQLITDVVTINRPGMVDNLLPSLHHLIYSPFLDIVKDMMSQDTAQPLVIIV